MRFLVMPCLVTSILRHSIPSPGLGGASRETRDCPPAGETPAPTGVQIWIPAFARNDGFQFVSCATQ